MERPGGPVHSTAALLGAGSGVEGNRGEPLPASSVRGPELLACQEIRQAPAEEEKSLCGVLDELSNRSTSAGGSSSSLSKPPLAATCGSHPRTWPSLSLQAPISVGQPPHPVGTMSRPAVPSTLPAASSGESSQSFWPLERAPVEEHATRGAEGSFLPDGGSGKPDTLHRSLFKAAKEDAYLQAFDLVVNYRAQLDFADRNGRTALFHAAENGSYNVVNFCLRYGARVNAVDARGATPTDDAEYWAAKGMLGKAPSYDLMKLEKTMEVLRSHGGTNTPSSEVGHHAVDRRRKLELLAAERKLVDRLPWNRNWLACLNVESPPVSASSPADVAEVRQEVTPKPQAEDATSCVACPASPSSDSKGTSGKLKSRCRKKEPVGGNCGDDPAWMERALRKATQEGDYHTAYILVAERGASLSCADGDGRTPLALASGAGSYNLVHFCLSRGADSNTKDKYGHTPVDDAEYWAAKCALDVAPGTVSARELEDILCVLHEAGGMRSEASSVRRSAMDKQAAKSGVFDRLPWNRARPVSTKLLEKPVDWTPGEGNCLDGSVAGTTRIFCET